MDMDAGTTLESVLAGAVRAGAVVLPWLIYVLAVITMLASFGQLIG